MRIGPSVIAVAAAALFISGLTAVVIPASASAYGPTNNTLKCWVHDNTTPQDISSTAASWPNGTAGHTTNDATLTVSAGPYTVGTPITVTNSYSQGPRNSAFPVAGETSTVTYQITNASGNTLVTGTPQNSFTVGSNGYLPGFTNTDTVTPIYPGATSISVNTVNFNVTSLGLQLTTACNAEPLSAPTPSPNPYTFPLTTSITQALTSNVVGATLNVTLVSAQLVTNAMRPGDFMVVNGSGWTPSATIASITIGGVSAVINTLLINGAGNISGTLTTSASTPTGNQNLVINDSGGRSVTKSFLVLGTPTLAVSPNSGLPGASIAVTGTNWDPTRAIVVAQCTGSVGPCSVGAPYNNGTTVPGGVVDALGNLTISPSPFAVLFTTGFMGATQTVSAGFTRTAASLFTVIAVSCTAQTGDTTGGSGCTTLQSLNALVKAANLSQQAFNTNLGSCTYAPNSSGQPYVGTAPQNVTADGATRLIGNRSSTQINLGYLSVSSASQTLTGCISRVHVTDQRGGNYGWSLTATMPNFADASTHSIPNSALVITPACFASASFPTSASGVTAGGTQTWVGTVTLCTKDTTVNVTSQSTAGEYDITGPLTLTVPALQHYGDYISVISIKLV